MMDGYEAILTRILEWAQTNQDVQAVILIGSRARTVERADDWSDLDLIIIADHISDYIQNSGWISAFGAPLLTFTEEVFDGSYERRVLYEGFLDVDFAFSDPEAFMASLEIGGVRDIFRRGYRVLLDKVNWMSRIQGMNLSIPQHQFSPDALLNEIHDYWYHCVWTAKKLQRGELWTAMNCLNCYMKNKLLFMIEVDTKLSEQGETDTWHNGRFLEKWADTTIVSGLAGSFGDYDRKSLVLALHHQMRLYHQVASRVAIQKEFAYPGDQIQEIEKWISSM